MKNLTFIFLFLCSTVALTQERFAVDVFFNPSSSSVNEGNVNQQSAFHTLINVSVEMKQTNSGYFFLGQSAEYANFLDGAYFRLAFLRAGYTFNEFLLRRMTASAAINYGLTRRWSQGFTNYGATFDISYRFSDRLKLASLFQIVRRNDLEIPMGINRKSIHSLGFFVGIKFNLFAIGNMI
jgi:hypothetical protein